MRADNHQVVVVARPTGIVGPEHFELRAAPMPTPEEGKALVRILWLSLDPAQRSFLNDPPPWGRRMALGDVMRGVAVAQVIDSRTPDLEVGELVEGWFGWQEHAVISPRQLGAIGRVPPGVSPQDALSVCGLTGLTAYFGVVEVGRPREGQTFVVSAAAGATGSVAGQVARILGCRVVGIAGGSEKCRWLTDVAGFDAAIDHRDGDVAAQLRDHVPGGVEVFFDNVGGDLLDAVLGHAAYDATIVVCGSVASGYVPDEELPPGPRNYVKISAKSIRMEGFTVGDFAASFEDATRQLRAWADGGHLVRAIDVVEGLDQAPAGLQRVFRGENLGKALVHLADPS